MFPWRFSDLHQLEQRDSFLFTRVIAFASTAAFSAASCRVCVGEPVVGYLQPTSGDSRSAQLVGWHPCSLNDWQLMAGNALPPSPWDICIDTLYIILNGFPPLFTPPFIFGPRGTPFPCFRSCPRIISFIRVSLVRFSRSFPRQLFRTLCRNLVARWRTRFGWRGTWTLLNEWRTTPLHPMSPLPLLLPLVDVPLVMLRLLAQLPGAVVLPLRLVWPHLLWAVTPSASWSVM